jgi:imidazolonepropionase-like amidohydrolase
MRRQTYSLNQFAAYFSYTLVLTGIIDFANGTVRGEPQFSPAELPLLTKHAREHGLKTFVHCSGTDGLHLAVAARVDSIEHGFFMNRAILEQMAEKRIVWVPTFIPVEFQARHGGWDLDTVAGLRRILDNHASMLVLAADLGVPVMAGSDAGSPGVKHGSGILEELKLMYAAGLDRDRVLAGATSVPQEHFRLNGGYIAVGRKADFITCDPLDQPV